MDSNRKYVLIVSYFFPDCSLTAAQRPDAWANELSKHGYFPIVITRKWERKIIDYADEGFPTSPNNEVEIYDHKIIYKTAYKSKLRDQFYIKYGKNKFKTIRQLLTASSLIIRNLNPRFSPFYPLYRAAEEAIIKYKPSIIIATANPYNQFYFGYLLSKKYNIPWIADYRDAWTTSQINDNNSVAFKLIERYNRHFEHKWCRTASLITAVSEPIAEKISKFVDVPFQTLPNGYRLNLFKSIHEKAKFDRFTITYIGSLYPSQKIELFLGAFKKWLASISFQLSPNILFPGLELFPEQKKRVLSFDESLNPFITTTTRLPQTEVLEIQMKSHCLLYVGWKGYEGVVPSKIFEYCASGTPILVAPADLSEVDKIVSKAKAGYSADNEAEVISYLNRLYSAYLINSPLQNDVDSSEILSLSSEEQVKKLASFFDKIIL